MTFPLIEGIATFIQGVHRFTTFLFLIMVLAQAVWTSSGQHDVGGGDSTMRKYLGSHTEVTKVSEARRRIEGAYGSGMARWISLQVFLETLQREK